MHEPVSDRVVHAALHPHRHHDAVVDRVLELQRLRPRAGLRHDLPDPTPTRLALALPAHRSDQVDAVRAERREVRVGERTMRRRPRRHLDVGREVPAPPRLIGEARDAAAPQLPPRPRLRLPARVHAEQQPRRGLRDHIPVRVLRPAQNPLRHVIEPGVQILDQKRRRERAMHQLRARHLTQQRPHPRLSERLPRREGAGDDLLSEWSRLRAHLTRRVLPRQAEPRQRV